MTHTMHMIGMCEVAEVVRHNKHSLLVVESCFKRFRGAGRCIGMVVVVEVNEYPALPRTTNAVFRDRIPCGT